MDAHLTLDLHSEGQLDTVAFSKDQEAPDSWEDGTKVTLKIGGENLQVEVTGATEPFGAAYLTQIHLTATLPSREEVRRIVRVLEESGWKNEGNEHAA